MAPIDAKNPIDSINSMNSMNILITGGCGFIGVNLIDFFIRRGIRKLRILDNLSVRRAEYLESALQSHGQITKNSVQDKKLVYIIAPNPTNKTNEIDQIKQTDVIEIELTIGDIRDKETCLEVTKGIDSVIHLAAYAGIIPSIENPYYDFEVNVLGTLNLLNSSVENKAEKFIFASSNAPLGNQEPPLNESKVPQPLSPYGASKLACEAYCSAFYNSYGLKTVSLRFSNAYGPYSLHKNSVIAKFIRDGLIKKVLTIYGDGNQTRDFIHVDDLCHAILLLFTPYSSRLNNGIWGETFHLGTGKETRIINLSEIVRGLFKERLEIVFAKSRKGEIIRNCSNIEKALRIFGFSPKIEIQQGVKGVFDWFLRQGKERIGNAQVLSGVE